MLQFFFGWLGLSFKTTTTILGTSDSQLTLIICRNAFGPNTFAYAHKSLVNSRASTGNARNSTISNFSPVLQTPENSFASRKISRIFSRSLNINFLYKMFGISEGSCSNIYVCKTFASHVLRQIASCKVPMNILNSHR